MNREALVLHNMEAGESLSVIACVMCFVFHKQKNGAIVVL